MNSTKAPRSEWYCRAQCDVLVTIPRMASIVFGFGYHSACEEKGSFYLCAEQRAQPDDCSIA